MDRNDKIGLAFFGLLLAAIVVCVFIENAPNCSASQPPPYPSGSAMHEDGGNGNPPSVSRNDCQWWGDGLAQWLMAFFTIVATGISLYAVKLVNATLQENRRASNAAVAAVTVTKEIGERQLRPYIVYEGGKVTMLTLDPPHPPQLQLHITVKNCGATPAVITGKSGTLYGGRERYGGAWSSLRVVVGSNQTQRLAFQGPNADRDGNFSWFSIGILIWYESLSGARYEDSFWLTFDGSEFRQDFPDIGRDLYRPDHEDSDNER